MYEILLLSFYEYVRFIVLYFLWCWRVLWLEEGFGYVDFSADCSRSGLIRCFSLFKPIALLFVSSTDGIIIPLISFLLVLIGVYFLIKVAGRLFERSVKFAWPSILNNLFGAIVGMLEVGVLAGSLFLLIEPIDASNKLISMKTARLFILQ